MTTKCMNGHCSTVDANIDEEELEALIENQTTSLFVGNVRAFDCNAEHNLIID